MPLELSREDRDLAVASLQRYFEAELDQRIGSIAAGALVGYMVEEIGPLIFNRAVAKVQERLQQRVQDLDVEFSEDAFQYWRRREQGRKGKR